MARAPGGAYKLYVGVDVAAATATAAWMGCDGRMSAALTIAQTTHGYAMLHERLATSGVAPADTLIVLEATGTYWITLATTLVEWGYQVSIV